MSIYQITILGKNGEKTPVQIDTQSGQAVHIQAEGGEQFQLIDPENAGTGPENITVIRHGDDLYIAFEGETEANPSLVIDGYYNSHTNGNLVVGLHENGQIYPYVPETAAKVDAIHALADGAVAHEALGGEIAMIPAFIPPWSGGLAGVGVPVWAGLGLLAAGGIAAAAGGGGGGHGSSPAPAPAPAGPEVNLEPAPASVNEGVGSVTYTVKLNQAAAADTTVDWQVTAGTGITADDFAANASSLPSGTVTIAKGQQTAVFTVPIQNDSVYEGAETYTVTLSNPSAGVSLGSSKSTTTTIYDNGAIDANGTSGTPAAPSNPTPADLNKVGQDDDRPYAIIEQNQSVNEGDGNQTVTYTVKLVDAQGQEISSVAADTAVNIIANQGQNDSAALNSDYTLQTPSVTFTKGNYAAQTVTVAIQSDDIYEGKESYTLSVKSADGNSRVDASGAKGATTVTTNIFDDGTTDGTRSTYSAGNDDDRPTIGIEASRSVNEGVGKVEYSLNLSNATSQDSTVTLYFAGTGSNPADAGDISGLNALQAANPNVTITSYDASSGAITLTIPHGNLDTNHSVKFYLPIVNDSVYEGKESYTLTLDASNSIGLKGVTTGKGSVETNIYDNGTTDGSTPANTAADPNNPNNSAGQDDDRPVVSLTSDASVNEGIGQVHYTLELNKTSTTDTKVTLQVDTASLSHPTNQDDFDISHNSKVESFDPATGIVVVKVPAGEQSVDFALGIAHNTEYEGKEQYNLKITKVESQGEDISLHAISSAAHTVHTTIVDDGSNPSGNTNPANNTPANSLVDDRPTVAISADRADNEAAGNASYTLTFSEAPVYGSHVELQFAGFTDNKTTAADIDDIGGLQALQQANPNLSNISYDAAAGTIAFDVAAGTKTNTVQFNLPIKDDTVYEGGESYTLTVKSASHTKAITQNTVTGQIWDNGTPDGTHVDSTSNDDRTVTVGNVSNQVAEGGKLTNQILTITASEEPYQYKFTINGTEQTIGNNALLNVDATYPLPVGGGSETFKITGYQWTAPNAKGGKGTAAITFEYASSVQDHSNATLSESNGIKKFLDTIKVEADLPNGHKISSNDTAIQIGILDSQPTAVDDNAALSETDSNGSIQTASGNVITGDANHANQGQDTIPDRDAKITQVEFNNVTHSVDVSNGLDIDTTNMNGQKTGTLHINADGSYTYTPTGILQSDEVANYNFKYTVVDKDGSDGMANLTIKLTGTNSAPEAHTMPDTDPNFSSQYSFEEDSSSTRLPAAAPNSHTFNLQDGTDKEDASSQLTYIAKEKGFTFANQDNSVSYTAAYQGQTASNGVTTYTWKVQDDAHSNYAGIITMTSKGLVTIVEEAARNSTSLFNALAEGDKANIPITYRMQDSEGQFSSEATQFIQVKGVNDRAYLSGNQLTILAVEDKQADHTIRIRDDDHNQNSIVVYDKDGRPTIFEAGVTADIAGKYGTYHLTASDGAGGVDLQGGYEVDSDNTAVKALSPNGDLNQLYDPLNVVSIDGNEHLIGSGSNQKVTGITLTASQAHVDNGLQALDAADSNSAVNSPADANVVSYHSLTDANLNLGDGNDVLYSHISGTGNISSNTHIDLGAGDDYYYAQTGTLSGTTTINGGTGDDTIAFAHDVSFNGTLSIDGGAGKDTLILGNDARIDGTSINMANIEVIDTRYGENRANQVTITEKALKGNGVDTLHVYGGDAGDTITFRMDDAAAAQAAMASKHIDHGAATYTYTDSTLGTITIVDELNIGINIVG